MSTDVRGVAGSVDELLERATSREPFAHPDGKSQVPFERVVIDGEPHILKYLDASGDWIMRQTGDLACRPIAVWRLGLLDRLPECFDHAVVGAAWDGRRGALLMRDVAGGLLPEGDHEIPMAQHLGFLDHMAQLHSAFWGWEDTLGLGPLENRYLIFHRRYLPAIEAELGTTAEVPTRYVPEGWSRFEERAPEAVALVHGLQDDVEPLVTALRTTPQTFVHGDWKAGNLGSHADGRTILIDWQFPGEAPPCSDLVWYVCLNRARLPHSKDDALAAYREALERHGIDTAPWWERQLSLCLLGALVQFGWEKALGDEEELAWWVDRALGAAGLLA